MEIKEKEAFLEFLRTKGVIKVGWNCLGVLTNLVREAGCTLSYNDIELMQEVWMEKAKTQALPVWVSTEFMKPNEGDLVLGISTTKIAKFNVYQIVALDEFEECGINYWMPLPDGPSESGADQ
ncbi:hypothetical protein [Acinetobacter nosocomialis]|uniref:hypothetical protein n=1 Tax=Acinetobacter nosocomialis TaxID=106654 RepID=UPI00125D9E6A|nr:hypothetical protein [Acinetobacter nosocomialis]